MANFRTKEMDVNGNLVKAVYTADDEVSVRRMVREKGHKLIRVELGSAPWGSNDVELFAAKLNSKKLQIFCKQLHTMLHAGMPLLTALDVLSKQVSDRHFSSVLKDLSVRVQKGEVLSAAMRAHGNYFPQLMLSMVASGELTGSLDSVMERMAEHYTKETKINSKIKGAMIYPSVLAVLAIGAVIFLLTNVIPQFVSIYDNAGGELPGITKFVLMVSESLQNYWYIYIAIVVLIVAAKMVITSLPSTRMSYDQMKLHMPILKKPIQQIVSSRFTRTFSTLLASGISLLASMESAAEVTGNKYVESRIKEAAEDIRKGLPLAPVFEKTGLFPQMMISMISIGEESGSLEEMLEKTADFYDEELESAMTQLMAAMEPMLILVIGGLIGVIIIAMLLPMFELFTQFGH